ncbi:alpha/beta hydrolase [Paenibacillus sp. NPDC058071]|uniref:alpha/beta hydrolase n=1 Tax=Paenibacillus sp. NPDC058071 TaxID=3346326 RepID=UPI0036DE54EC
MALINCDFFSETLGMSSSMTVLLPQQTLSQIGMEGVQREGRHPVLYLLHGLSDDHTIWLRRSSIERYVSSLGLAVVMPNVHRSFYADMEYGGKYWTFLTEELPAVARSFFPLSEKREDNFVAGLSMGGFGAFKWALNQPEQFAAAASLSGVLDLVMHRDSLGPDNGLYEPIYKAYGDKDIRGTKDDLIWAVNQADSLAGPKPLLYQCCGTSDFLYRENTSFRNACEQTGLQLTYSEEPADHEWGYWDKKIQDVLNWLPL